MARDTNITIRLRDRFSTGMRTIGKRVRSLRKRFLGLKTAAVAAIAVLGGFAVLRKVKNFFAGALGIAKDLEQQLAVVKAVTGATGEEFEKLAAAARKAGETTIFTATEAGQGLEELARAGLTATEAISSLPHVLNLAQAEAIRVGQAAQFVSTTLNQFNLAASESERVADVLSRTAQKSGQTVKQLAQALEEAGPAASLAGLKLEETAGLIGGLADSGIRASKAGTALRNALSQLQDPGSKFSETLSQLGIESDNLVEIFQQLAAKGPAAEQAFIALGLEAGPKLRSLLNEGKAGFVELIRELEGAEGTAERTANEMNKTLTGALKNLGSAWESLQESFVRPLLEPLTEQVQDLTAKLREFAGSPAFERLKEDLVEGFRNAVAAVREFLADFDFKDATRKLGDFVRSAGEKTKALTGHVSTMLRAFKVVSAGIRTVLNGFQTGFSFLGALATKANEKILGAIDSMTGGLIDLSDEIEHQRETSSKLFQDTFEQAKQTRAALADLRDAWRGTNEEANFFTKLEERARDTWDFFRAAVRSATNVETAFEKLTAKIQEAADADALETIRLNLEHMRRTGEITKDQFALAIGTIIQRFNELGEVSGDTAESVERDAKSALETIRTFGFNVSEQLKQDAERARSEFIKVFEDTESTLAQKQQAWKDYAAAAIEANDGIITSELRAQAHALGMVDALEEIANKGEEAGKRAGKGLDEVGDAARRANQETAQLQEGTEDAGSAFEEAQKGAKGAAAAIASIAGRYKQLGGTIGELGQEMIRQNGRLVTTITGFFRNLGRDLRRVEDEYQRNAEAFDRWRAKLEAGEITAGKFANAIRSIGGEAAVLDKQRLDFFRQQLAKAQQQAADLRREFLELNQQIERDFLSATGAEAELVKREFDQREQRLRDAFEALTFTEQQEQRAEFRESLSRLKELEKQKLNEIRERQRAERKGNEETHRQREAEAQDFHGDELERAEERSRANTGSVIDYNKLREEERTYHEERMQHIRQQGEAQRQEAERVRQAFGGGDQARGTAEALGFQTGGGGGRLEVVHRVLSDSLNGQGLNMSSEQLNELTQKMLQELVRSGRASGFRRIN